MALKCAGIERIPDFQFVQMQGDAAPNRRRNFDVQAERIGPQFRRLPALPGIAAGSGKPAGPLGGEKETRLAGKQAAGLEAGIDRAATQRRPLAQVKVVTAMRPRAELQTDLRGEAVQ